MQRNKGELAVPLLMVLLSAQIAAGNYLKVYEESYHRPSYYNRAHKASNHVNYNREMMDQRDVTTPHIRSTTAVFDPSLHLSYYAHILYKGSVFCVGSLITRRMIVTSSRCFIGKEQYRAKHMTVLTGNDFGTTIRKEWQVIAFFMPVGKNESNNVHDIVLLALDRKLEQPTYRHISLFQKMPKPGTKVQMAFVDTYTHDITLFNTKVVKIERCKESYGNIGKSTIPFSKDFICVKNKKSGGCSTRPGDPLILDNKLVGVNIYGEHCDELEGEDIVDIYFAIRNSIPHMQQATDLLRAFTGTGPFNSSLTTKRTQLYQDTTTEKLTTT